MSKKETNLANKAAFMTAIIIIISTFVPLFAGTFLGNGGEVRIKSEVKNTLTSHEPIRVDGSFNESIWGGSGTADDPYVLDNYSIDGRGYGYSVYVGNVSDHFVIENCELYNASGGSGSKYYPNAGIVFYNSAYGNIVNNSIHENHYGIYFTAGEFEFSHDNEIKNNSILENEIGVKFNTNTESNNISNNSISQNNQTGILLSSSSSNTISNNSISQNNQTGILLDGSDKNNIWYNTIRGHKNGTVFKKSDNTDPSDNTFHHNNFVNDKNANITVTCSNTWDNGTFGNYWSDYSGNDSDNDGIGEENYTINSNNVDYHPVTHPVGIDHIEIKANRSTVTAGEKISFTSKAYDENGFYLDEVIGGINWSIESGSHGSWNNNNYTSESQGTWNVTGKYNYSTLTKENITISDETSIKVNPGDVDSVTISPSQDQTVKAGEKLTFDAKAYDANDNLITDSESDFTWKNTNETGVFNKTSTGEYDVNAAYNGTMSSTVNVTVEPSATSQLTLVRWPSDFNITAGNAAQFTVEVQDEYGNANSSGSFKVGFCVNNTENKIIDIGDGDADGTVSWTKKKAKTYQIQFKNSSGALDPTETYDLTVEPSQVDSVEINSNEKTVTAGKSISFTAAAFDEFGNLICDNVSDFNWENASEGTFSMNEAGKYNVSASYNGVNSGAITVTVEPAQVDSVSISVDNKTVTAGERLQFSAEAEDQYGNVITDDPTDFDWNNATDGVFSINKTGKYNVSASYNGVNSAVITVTVEPAQVDSVSISVDNKTVTAGQQLQFSAEAVDQHGNVITDDPTDFDWNNATDGVFSINKTGKYNVSASYNGVDSTVITVTVEPAQVDSVIVSSDKTTATARTSLRLSAQALDKYDNVISEDPADFEWKNADKGDFYKETSGQYEVSATYRNVTSSAVTITVKPAQVDSISVSAEKKTVTAGEKLQFSAKAEDQYGNVITSSDSDFDWKNADGGTFQEEKTGQYDVTATYNGVTSQTVTVTVKTASADHIELTPENETIGGGDAVKFTVVVYDRYANRIVEITESSNFSIKEDGHGGEWDGSEYHSKNAGDWTVVASYEGMTDEVTLTVTADSDLLKYVGLNTIVFEENLDYELRWEAANGSGITDFKLLAGNSTDSLETVAADLTDNSYTYRFEKGQTVQFRLVGYDSSGKKVESIDFEVKTDILTSEKSDVKISKGESLQVSLPQARSDLSITWFVDGQKVGSGKKYTPDLSPGNYEVTAKISDGSEQVEKQYDLKVTDSKKDAIPTEYLFGGIGVAAIVIILALLLKKGGGKKTETGSHPEESSESSKEGSENYDISEEDEDDIDLYGT